MAAQATRSSTEMPSASFSPLFVRKTTAGLTFLASAIKAPSISRGQDANDAIVVRHVRHEGEIIETQTLERPPGPGDHLAGGGQHRPGDPGLVLDVLQDGLPGDGRAVQGRLGRLHRGKGKDLNVPNGGVNRNPYELRMEPGLLVARSEEPGPGINRRDDADLGQPFRRAADS